MLKIKAALVSLVLGSSSVALASPGVTFTAGAQAGFSFHPTVRDHRDHREQPAYPMPSSTSWRALSAPMSLRNGTSTLRPQLGSISQLRLQAKRGFTYVYRVELRFRDGTYQSLAVNKWLTTASAIDLQVRNRNKVVDTIKVIGSANRRATHQVFAHTSRVEAPIHPAPHPIYQPPVYQPPVYQPPVYQGISLGQDLSFYGTDGRRFLTVGADKGAFNTLRLTGASGTTYVPMIKIVFTDGSEQLLGGVNKTLLAGQSVDIELDGYNARTVSQVIVWTDTSGRAIQTSTGTFNASLL